MQTNCKNQSNFNFILSVSSVMQEERQNWTLTEELTNRFNFRSMDKFNYTFIIPHKNCQKLLLRCLNSIPERPDIQVIIVDDNSDPEVVDFEEFPGKNRTNTDIYLTKEGRGAGYARNVGLKHAIGKWILFADADDYYKENFIDVLDRYVDSNSDILFFNVDSKQTNISAKYDNYFSGKGKLDDIRLFWNPWNKMFSYDLIKKSGVQFDEIPVGNDAMFCLKVNDLARNVTVIKDKLYVYSSDNVNSLTLRDKDFNRVVDYLKINIKINKFFRQRGKDDYAINIITFQTFKMLFRKYGIASVFAYLQVLKKEDALCIETYSRLKYLCKRLGNYIVTGGKCYK